LCKLYVCYRLDSVYKTSLFQGITTNDEKFPLRLPNEEKNLSTSEFVSMICDIFQMHKNICICRHFDLYNKTDIVKYDYLLYDSFYNLIFYEQCLFI